MSEEPDEELNADDDTGGLLEPNADVAAAPSEVADPSWIVERTIPESIRRKYEVYSYRNAAVILSETRQSQFKEILDALDRFTLTTNQIRMPGGNESDIPKAFTASLRPNGWFETIIQGDLLVRLTWGEPIERRDRLGNMKTQVLKRQKETLRERYLDGHKIDYVKDRVAFDLEWNSKDQTFDRDLYAFNAFSQCGVIDAAILLTRSADLNPVFHKLGPALRKDGTVERKRDGTARMTKEKYGASTTWMGKLLYRLNAGRNGSCPVLAVGIRRGCISDLGDQ